MSNNRSNHLIAVVSAEIDAETLRPRLPEGVDVRRLPSPSADECRIELQADAARFDVRSLHLLFGEALAGSPADTRLPYERYRAFQQELLRNPDWVDERLRWQAETEIDTSRVRLAGQQPRTGDVRLETIERVLPEPLVRSARELTVSRGWEPAALWLTAWTIVLSRRTGEHELLVSVGMDGRNYEEVVQALGPYGRDVPLRVRFDEHACLGEVVATLGTSYHRAWSNQEHYDDRTHSAGVWPFGFEYLEWPDRESCRDIDWTVLQSICARPHANDARLRIENTRRGVRLTVEYDASVHAQATMTWLLGGVVNLARQAIERPDARVAEVDDRSDEERARWVALNDGQQRASAASVTSSLHTWIERHAAASPTAIAVAAGEHVVNYGELNARANRLARHLARTADIPREARIGVCLPRGPAFVTAMLAVWKAGAAYVPLDDEWPAARAAALLAHTGASAVIADARTARVVESAGVPIVDIDRDRASIDRELAGNLDLDVAAEQLAYVLFTSGSTGQPKGVAVEHRQLAHYAEAILDRLGPRLSAIWATLTTGAADLGNTAILGALCSGGRLEWIVRQTASDAAALDAYCRTRPIHVAKMTPSHARALLAGAAAAPAWLPDDVLVLGGETLGGDLVDRIRALKPQLRLVNHYGPTETTIGVLAGVVERPENVGLGTPLGSAHVWVCHPGGTIAGIGDAGELWIGGPGVARGYWGEPALTADRFRPDPHGGTAGGRVYRSGDRAALAGDGALVYLGRSDDQVKVRGYRVEPAEVTHALRALPGVRDAAVLARTDASAGDVQLTAYVVADAATTPDDWRKAAEATLPTYMLPAHWVRLERLPLLSNGKLDRRALPGPRVAVAPFGDTRPLTPTEEVVAAVWMAVLAVPVVGPNDDFFALGGDSILSLRALSLLQGRGLDVSLQLLTESSVLSDLARAIDGREALVRPSAAADAHTPEFDEDRYPLTQLQLGMLYHADLTPAARVYHDISSIHVRLPLHLPLLQASLDLLAERHAVLRTSFDLTDDNGPSQRVHPHVAMSLEVADWRGMPADEQERLLDAWMERERVTPFDVSRAPLIRFTVQQRSDDSFQLGSACHHAILDGWSSTVMRAELLQDYGRRIGLPLPPLPEAPANLLREYVRLERSTWDSPSSRTFWRDLLQDAEPLRLPRPAVAERVQGFTQVNVPIAADVWRAANEHARGAALPLRTVCLAAHLRVCALLAGRTDVITGFVSNGRPELPGSDRSLGLFLNTLPLRLDVGWDDTWRHTCETVLARERAILPHRRFPLAEIQRDAGRGALFEVNFNFVNFHEYGPLLRAAGDRFLGSRSFSVTHFALVANFAVDPVSRLPGLELQFHDDRFSEEQIAQITAAYRRAMESLASHGLDCRCSHRWLSQEMRLSAIEGRRAAGVRDPLSWLDIDLAPRCDDPAIVSGADVMTYAQIAERARRLAGALRERGVNRGDPVGVCLERGADLVCAMVATLGMGAVYVPIDPSLPDTRMQTLLTHAGCRVVITIEETAERVTVSEVHLLLTDRLDAPAAAGPREWRREVEPEDLAYVIYTSGSTGQPKGVAMTCRAVMNLVEWQLGEWRTQPPRRTLLIASPGFDVSVQETLCTLAAGGTLDVVTDDVKRDPDGLWRHICTAGVERTFAPPVLVHALADAAARSPRETRLHEIIAAGEALKITAAVREFLSRHDVSLVNQYGPTETHVVSSAAVRGPRERWPLLPPIGSPIAATNLTVLDAEWQPVLQGVAGELWIGGDCLAQGYLRDPVLTAERFVPDPLSRAPGGRLYRSGDRVVCRDDLQLDYIGRVDGQLKIRGYRVEVSEIEVTLAGCGGVKDAAVVARPAHTGDAELWAFVVATDPSRVLDVSSILNELRHRLPAYMVPARVAVIDRLPVLTNGKVDRQQLASWPAPEIPVPTTRPPVSAAEHVIADTIAAVLGLSAGHVGLDDDFYEIGGNSLTAVQVAVRLGDLVDRTLTVGVVVVNRTVAEIHAALAGEIGADRLEQIAETVKAVGALAMEDVEGMLNAGSPS